MARLIRAARLRPAGTELPRMSDLRPLLAYAAPHRAALALGVGLMLLESAAALAVPWLGGKLTGAFLQGDAARGWTVPAVLAAMLALFGVQALLKFGNTYLLGNAGEKIVADLKIRVYDHLQALPLSFFHQRRQGDTLALLTHDVYVVSGYVSGTALADRAAAVHRGRRGVLHVPPGAGAGAARGASLIPLFFLLLKIFGRRIRPLATQLSEEHATAIAIAEENLGMLPAIKTFTREAQESARHRRADRPHPRADGAAAEDRGRAGARPSSSSPRPASCSCCGSPAARSPAASSPRPSW